LGVPILGICYGMQLMAHQLGGKVQPGGKREYGPAEIEQQAGLLSFNLAGQSPSRVGLILDQAFGIMHEIWEAATEAAPLNVASVEALVTGVLTVDQVRALIVHYYCDLLSRLNQALGHTGYQRGLAGP
jgi:hypothetical protein